MPRVAGGLRTACVATGSFQKVVLVVVPTTIPRYSTVPGFGRADLSHAVGLAESARMLDCGQAQKTEACAFELNVAGNLTCEMHGALLG
ncbi:hypothetical protein AJ87_26875 [Rhizobium yanglingense]|nr:hypothetical protein AJ87_26875 [Rhizobium yanglingense]